MKTVRVGNGCGFWGDNLDAPILLARDGRLDYLTLEYLAELTMSILAAPAKAAAIRRPALPRTFSMSWSGCVRCWRSSPA